MLNNWIYKIIFLDLLKSISYIIIYLGLLSVGPTTPNSKDSASSSKEKKEEKPKKEESREKEKEKDKEKGNKQTASFPPSSNTTDAVRLKCRELLANAIKGNQGRYSWSPIDISS